MATCERAKVAKPASNADERLEVLQTDALQAEECESCEELAAGGGDATAPAYAFTAERSGNPEDSEFQEADDLLAQAAIPTLAADAPAAQVLELVENAKVGDAHPFWRGTLLCQYSLHPNAHARAFRARA